MKRFFKAVTAFVLVLSNVMLTFPTVQAENADIAKYNRHLFDTSFSAGNEKVFSITADSDEDVLSTISVKNYTEDATSFAVKAYAVDKSGEKKTIYTSITENIASGAEKKILLNIGATNISDDTELIEVVVKPSDETEEYTVGELYVTDEKLTVPVIAPADSDGTTNGAHDPTIFKDPVSGKYFAYSTHNLISESDDLINWVTKSYTEYMPQKTVEFIGANYSGTTVNGTYWAPDLIYMENDTEHPYWYYLSVSCGLGGRNSAIGLIKSSSPRIWDGENIEDCGVVLATKENSSYITNAIDANLYTDVDGKNYFIWGSFWGGIQIAPLDENGFVEGVDYTSASTIIESSKNVKNTIFAAPGGVLGPEGPYMITNEDEGYRYLFVSYGWLGSNYNTRVARAPISKTIAEAIADGTISTFFTDHNGRTVGTSHTSSRRNVWGYKLIGSYQFASEEAKYSVSQETNASWQLDSGNAQTYYANAHNSVLCDTDGEWYFVHHTKKHIDWAGILCVRKMMWINGWPVVAPTSYAGEKLQDIPEAMIDGTYNLSSVGKTILPDGVTQINSSRDADLPVSSSFITLLPDGTLDDGLGTWTFDSKHTVTLKFNADGDNNYSKFYKSGDTYTMNVIMGYDKNEGRYVLSLTGTDQNNISQFAVKPMEETVYSIPDTIVTTPVTVSKSTGGNPVLGFDASGNILYGGDPAATVVGDTVYLYVGHDTAQTESYNMPEWVCYTSKDMKNWEYKGAVMSASDISWASNDTSAWASQMAEYNGKYYLYFCTWDKTDGGNQSIGVAVADSPLGPFKDIGAPLVKGSVTAPATSTFNDIDPTVWIEEKDGETHRYLGWGNGKYYLCELNEDMVSVKDKNGDSVIDMGDIREQRFTYMGGIGFTEAPWLYRRQDADGNYYGQYYTFFAQNWREEMAYAVSDDITSNRWTYKGRIMQPTATSNTNHPSVIDFKGKTYFIYHNGALTKGSGFRRSVCVQELEFDDNGNVYPLTELSTGIGGVATTIKTRDNKYVAHEEFENPLGDGEYPISKDVIIIDSEDGLNSAWEIVSGLYDKNNENYVSIQSVNKPGLYIKENSESVTLTADADGTSAMAMTFKTVKAIDGKTNGVSFESITENGKFLTVSDGKLTMTYGKDAPNCSFVIGGAVSPTPVPTLAPVPTATPEPDLSPDRNYDFNSTGASTLISMTQNGATVYEDLEGLKLHINNRGSGGDTSGNFKIESGGVTGNALVMNSGRYSSASRGPRMEVVTPYIPLDSTAKLTMSVKLTNGSGGDAKLYYNDNVSGIDDSKGNVTDGTDIGLLADGKWHTLECEVKNDNETYIRTISIDGEVINKAYIDKFPVFWGTIANNTYAKVFFDNVTIVTNAEAKPLKARVNGAYIADGSLSFVLNGAGWYDNLTTYVAEYKDGVLVGLKAQETDILSNRQSVEVPYKKQSADNLLKVFVWYGCMPASYAEVVTNTSKPVPEGCTSYFAFENNLEDTVKGTNGTLTGNRANLASTVSSASYTDGYNGRAISFSGADSYGVNLGKVITNSVYTLSFRMKANAITAFTPAIFIDADGGSKWVSAPFGWQSDGTFMIWSNNGSGYIDFVSSYKGATGKWYQITMVADGENMDLYIDSEYIGSGKVADVADNNTNTVLAVNYWDTPFNGLIDDLYIYDGTKLSADDISLLYEATVK